MLLLLYVTDVSRLSGIKGEVADRSNEIINTKGHDAEEEVSESSRSVSLGLEIGVVDYDTTNPTKEEGQKKTDEFVVVDGHSGSP